MALYFAMFILIGVGVRQCIKGLKSQSHDVGDAVAMTLQFIAVAIFASYMV